MNEQQETLYVADVDMPDGFRPFKKRIAELEQNPERKAALDKARERLHHIANAGKVMPNLWPVINWLENGGDPKEAAKELRIYESQRQNHSGEVADMVQEPVECCETYGCTKPCPKYYTTPPTAPNLNCKSVQRRLATSWGYVRKEEYDMARVAAATAMRDAAVRVCRVEYPDDYIGGSEFEAGRLSALREVAEAIAALPILGEEK